MKKSIEKINPSVHIRPLLEIVIQYYCLKLMKSQHEKAFVSGMLAGLYIPKKFRYYYKLCQYEKGAPDGIIVFKGKVAFLEFKTKSGKQSKHQKIVQKKINEQGVDNIIYVVLRSAKDFHEFVKEFFGVSVDFPNDIIKKMSKRTKVIEKRKKTSRSKKKKSSHRKSNKKKKHSHKRKHNESKKKKQE